MGPVCKNCYFYREDNGDECMKQPHRGESPKMWERYITKAHKKCSFKVGPPTLDDILGLE